MNLHIMSLGDIVRQHYATAQVFLQYHIDYFCDGDRTLASAAGQAGVDLDYLTGQLQEALASAQVPPFGDWPLDLIIDYTLKIHHRRIRTRGFEILALVRKVAGVHGAAHPELLRLKDLFVESLQDLLSHLDKEEQVLFPYVLELFEANERGDKLPPMHCGSVLNPIGVMRMEHAAEGARYQTIRELTNDYTAPEGACSSYRQMMSDLEWFMTALFEHIHIENNIIFPEAYALEQRLVEGL